MTPFKEEIRLFKKFCCYDTKTLLCSLGKFLQSYYSFKNLIITKDYIFARGTIPIALVAHADTVFPQPPIITHFFYDPMKTTMWHPDGMGADDRAGILMIYRILQTTNLRPSIIITTDEEIGAVGAQRMLANRYFSNQKFNFLVQLDRRGFNDSVYYNCANSEFERYINSFGFKTNFGTFTDISVLAPVLKCAAVNLSVGYEDEHSYTERLNFAYWYCTFNKVCKILKAELKCSHPFKYIPARFKSSNDIIHWQDAYDDDDNDTPFVCDVCHKEALSIDRIEIIDEHGSKIPVCVSCFSHLSPHVHWCTKCHMGFYTPNKIYDDTNKQFICNQCRKHQYMYKF